MKNNLRIGIVGTGMIAQVIAKSIETSEGAELVAISGRDMSRTKDFARQFVASSIKTFDDWNKLIADNAVEAIYIGTPTAAKEEIALVALRHGKHVLVDKPLGSSQSVRRMIDAAKSAGVALMDATHFVHHPRTQAIKDNLQKQIGEVKSLRAAFYFPFEDQNNIRFDSTAEPMGALGDLAWYNMRAAVEFLGVNGASKTNAVTVQRDSKSSAIVRAAGLMSFDEGKTFTWDIGYNAGTVLMDLDIIGTSGVISVDDFVLDRANSFAFQDKNSRTGYQLRSGTGPRNKSAFVDVPSDIGAHVRMIDTFAKIAKGAPDERAATMAATERTQKLLDAIWEAANKTSV